MAKNTGVGSPLTAEVNMTLKETLAHLKSLGNEKVPRAKQKTWRRRQSVWRSAW